MPDRQRHGRLTDVLAGLFPARFRKAPAPAGRRRSTAPAGRRGAGMAERHDVSEAASRSAGRQTVDLGRSGWNGSEGNGSDRNGSDRNGSDPSRSAWEAPDPQDRQAGLFDPMAVTTQLPRVSPPWTPTAAAPAPGFGPGVIAGYDAPANIANVASPVADAADVADAAIPAEAEAEAEAGAVGVGVGVANPAEAGAADIANPAATAPATALAPAPAQPFADLVRTLVRTLLQQQRRRLAIGAAGVVALAALLALPPVWAQLRDSFVRKPEPYTALYFTTPPQVDGTVLTVPVSVHAAETGTTAYRVRVWTVDTQGHVDDTRDADLKWDGQALSAVVSMPVNPAASYVWVSLGGSNETLHYKIAVA